MDPTNTILTEIRERVVRVETKLDNMNDVKKTAEDAKETAAEALQQGKSAHHRLNKIDKIIFFLGTTVIGAVVLGLLNILLRGGQ